MAQKTVAPALLCKNYCAKFFCQQNKFVTLKKDVKIILLAF